MLFFKLTVAILAVSVFTFSGLAQADDAIEKDRQLYAGTWQISSLEVNGNKVSEEDAEKIAGNQQGRRHLDVGGGRQGRRTGNQ